MIIALFSGLAAGMAHVIAGPDHLAALAPIAVDKPRRAMALGFRWGLGHGLGVALLGGLGVFASALLDVQSLSAWSEFFVGFALVFVGLWSARSAFKMVVHTHGHEHRHSESDGEHSHFHVHASEDNHDAPEAHRGHSHAAFAVGMLHGAAGTGHLLGVLPSLALPTASAVVYLSAYFVAAVAAMVLFGGLLGFISKRQSPLALRRVMYSASACAVVLGVVWIGQAWPS